MEARQGNFQYPDDSCHTRPAPHPTPVGFRFCPSRMPMPKPPSEGLTKLESPRPNFGSREPTTKNPNVRSQQTTASAASRDQRGPAETLCGLRACEYSSHASTGNQLLLLLVAVGLGFLVEDSFTTVYGLVRKKGTRLCHHLAERASACTSRRQGAA